MNSKSKFRCSACRFVTKRKHDAIRHSLIHFDIKLYKCVDCSYESNYKERYEIHLKKHNTPFSSVDRKRVIEQPVCTKFAPVDDDSESVTGQAVSTPFASVDDDDRKGIMDQAFSQLILTISKNKFKCLACGQILKGKRHAISHSLLHSHIKLYKCVHCNYGSNYKHKYKMHLKKHKHLKKNNTTFSPVDNDSERVMKQSVSTPLDPVDDRKRIMEEVFSQFVLKISKDEFKCSACSYVGKNKTFAVRHALIHSDVKLYKCPDCNYESNYKYKYRSHLGKKHDTTFAPVDNDSERVEEHAASTPRDLSDDDSERVEEQAISTPLDPVDDDRKRIMEEVFSQFVLKISKDEFKCSACSYVGKNKTFAVRHALIHSDVKLYKCPDCNYESNYKYKYRSHLGKKHDTTFAPVDNDSERVEEHATSTPLDLSDDDSERVKEQAISTPLDLVDDDRKRIMEKVFSQFIYMISKDEFECSACDFVGKNKSKALRHALIHSDVKLYKCPDCNYESNRKDRYRIHLWKKHDTPFAPVHDDSERVKEQAISTPFDPVDDDKERIMEQAFSKFIHMISKKKFKCFACGYVTKEKRHAVRHSLIHSDIKLYKCVDCNYESNYKNKYEVHLKQHNTTFAPVDDDSERVEEQTTSTPFDLTDDESEIVEEQAISTPIAPDNDDKERIMERIFAKFIHMTSKKKFKCFACGYVTKEKRHAVRHSLIHSDIKLYKCVDCNYESNYKNKYEVHLKWHNTTFAHVDNDSERVEEQATSTPLDPVDDDRKRIMEEVFSQFIFMISKDEFGCSACGYVGKNKSRALHHALSHSDVKLYKCPDCNYENNRKDRYRIHLWKKHGSTVAPVDNDCERVKKQSISSPLDPVENDYERVKKQAISTSLDPDDNDSERDKEQSVSTPFTSDNEDSERAMEQSVSTPFAPVYDDDRKKIMEQAFSQLILTISKNKFKCFACGHISNGKRNAISHSLIHSDIKLYKCVHCNYGSNYKHKYKIHLKKHKHLKKNKTTFSPVDNDSERVMKRSVSTPLDPADDESERFEEQATSSPFDPVDDDKERIMEQAFSKFIYMISKKKFKCFACGYVTKEKRHAVRHSLIHSDIKLYKCVDCNYESNYKNKYEVHLKWHNTTFAHVDNDSERVEEQATSTPFDIAADESEIVEEQAVSTPLDPVDDDRKRIMEEVFSQFIFMISKDEFKCSACDFVGKNKSSALRHTLIHSDVKLYKCPDCNYESNRKDNYKIHLRKKHDIPFAPVEDDSERVKEQAISTSLDSADNDSERDKKQSVSTSLDSADNDSERDKEQSVSTPFAPVDDDSERVKEQSVSTPLDPIDNDSERDKEQSVSTPFAPVDDDSERVREQSLSIPFAPVDGDSERVLKQSVSTPYAHVYYDTGKVIEQVFSKFILTISKDKFKCLFCGYVAKQKSNAARHSLIHSDIKLYKCTYCNYECNRKDKYRIHLENKHIASSFKCKVCDFTTSQKHLMDEHNASHQSQGNNLRKDSRKESNLNSSSNQVLLQSGLKKRKNCEIELFESRFSKIARYVDGGFICAICHYKTESRAGAQRHSMVHTNMWYLCSECDCEFIGQDVYETHIKDYHENKSIYKCGDCDFTCDLIAKYYSHVSSHTKVNQRDPVDVMEKLYSCDECNYKTRYQNRLLRHKRVHISHKNLHKKILEANSSDPYEAQLDKYSHDFSDSIIERDGHVFKCSLCTYVSVDKYRVRRHCLIHSETKFYKCIDCKFETNRKYQYKKHIRRMHSDKYKGSSTAFSIESSNDNEESNNISESKIDDLKYESNVNYISYVEEETLPVIYCETELVAENPKMEDTEPFLIGHIKSEPPELISVDDGIVDPSHMEDTCSQIVWTT